MAESGQQQQQGGQQEEPNPAQFLAQSLSRIRRVQSLLELNYPDQTDAIQMQREAGDILWKIIESMQQSQQAQR